MVTSIAGLPGGYRNNDGTFNNIGNNGNWWSSTENNTTNAWNRNLNYNNSNVNRNNNDKRLGFSVRCVRDLMIGCVAQRAHLFVLLARRKGNKRHEGRETRTKGQEDEMLAAFFLTRSHEGAKARRWGNTKARRHEDTKTQRHEEVNL